MHQNTGVSYKLKKKKKKKNTKGERHLGP